MLANVMEDVPRFYEGALSVDGALVVPFSPTGLQMVVLVVDDSGDDELISAMAELAAGTELEPVSALGYDGAWDALDTGDHHALKFRLIRTADTWERAWTYIDPPREMVDAITSGDSHYVAVIPREFAGDLTDFDLRSIAGGVIVEVAVREPGRSAMHALCGY